MVMHSTHSHNTFITNLFLVHFNKQEFGKLASGRYNNFWLVVAILHIAVSFSNPFRTIPDHTSLRGTQTHTQLPHFAWLYIDDLLWIEQNTISEQT